MSVQEREAGKISHEMESFLYLVGDLNKHQSERKPRANRGGIVCKHCRAIFPCDAARALWVIKDAFRKINPIEDVPFRKA